MAHPMMGAKVEHNKATSSSSSQPRSPGLNRFEHSVEERWQGWKYNDCIRGRERIEAKIENLRGFMGIGTDWDAIKKLKEQKVEACEELKSKGFRIA
jgi:DnaJ homolog subfamily B member 12